MSCPNYDSSAFYLTNSSKDFGDISFAIKYMNDASLLVDCFYCLVDLFKLLLAFSEVLFYLFKLVVYYFECFDPPIGFF